MLDTCCNGELEFMYRVKENVDKIANLTFYYDDFEEKVSIIEFFRKMLLQLWERKDYFESKHPFGSRKDWDDDLAICLIENGVIPGVIEDKAIREVDWLQVNFVIETIIENLSTQNKN